MSILSIKFVAFVLITVIIYYIIPLKFRWLVLLAASCVFYALAGWQGCIWLVAVAAIAFLSSLWQGKLVKRAGNLEVMEEAAREAAAKVVSETEGSETENWQAKTVNSETENWQAKTVNSETENWQTETASENLKQPAKKVWLKTSKQVNRFRKVLLAVSIILPFLALAFSKFFDIFCGWFKGLSAFELIVPLGLSYFTFQSVGYMIDIYQAKYEPEKNPLKYLLFASFFPQMTQGPISTYDKLSPQLTEGHRFNPDNFVMGLQLALWGFFKKMVIADRLTPVTQAISVEEPGWVILLTVVIYAIRLYADFSGGMDVIRGAAKMLGVDMPENFKRPFFSHSVAEYWRRWHITLGAWFRSYLFYPFTTSGAGLALSKAGRKIFGKKAGRALPAAVSTVIVFFIIGIWHTANWNAVIFGFYFGLEMGIVLLLEPSFKKLKKKLKINEQNIWWKIYTMVRTWVLILIPQYFAFTDGPATGFALIGNTFKNFGAAGGGVQLLTVMKDTEWVIVILAAIVLVIVDVLCEYFNDLNERLAKGWFVVRWPVLVALILAILVFGCYGTGYDATAFLYTNF